MRFPNPVAVACRTCGQPTVVAETMTGPLRVHCGTWRWQCDIPTDGRRLADRPAASASAQGRQRAVPEPDLGRLRTALHRRGSVGAPGDTPPPSTETRTV